MLRLVKFFYMVFLSSPSSVFTNALLLIATVKENSRSLFNFEAHVDWHQRHEFLKCKLMLLNSGNRNRVNSFLFF